VADVEKIAKAGAEICISPNLDLEVVLAAQKLGINFNTWNSNIFGVL